MNKIVSELVFMAGIFVGLVAIAVCGLLLGMILHKMIDRLKTKLRDVHGEQVIAALMLIGLVILFMFYGPIIMF